MTADGHDHGWRGRRPDRVLRFPLTRIVLGFVAIIAIGNLARIPHRGGAGRAKPA